MKKTKKNPFAELFRYPSAVFGLVIILGLVVLAIYAMAKIPYAEAIRLWRGGEEVWYQNPKNVPPIWYNWFSKEKMSESFAVKVSEDGITKTVTPGEQNTSTIEFTYSFDYDYDDFPQELFLYFKTKYSEKQPFVSVYLITPDNREIRVSDFGVSQTQTFRFSQDEKLVRRLKGLEVMKGLFVIPDSDPMAPLKGTYQLLIKGLTFEQDSDIDVEFVLHGQTYGLAGTDHARRDLMVPLLWGAPIAIAFGLLAAMGTSVLSMAIAAIGAWFGGWLDELIQRITEINLVLPFLAILIMIGTFYSRSIWVILGVTILLSIFTGAIKTNRAIFLQVKESTYIEAARAYGASSMRIIFRYLIPRMIPLLIPALVSAVPAYVFLEASLAVLGLGDPVLPTWGKMINDAQVNGALYKGYYYWILEPAVLLMITGLGFAMLGFALDRVFNPRLRGI
ncbi:MAG: ABC transporter permease [Chloroflexi bacterium HGW-Chloroflexi-10]|nr:MAG: ABC transporter permease [Chloroflexi bacterium HGW-Chloroflexi-10]